MRVRSLLLAVVIVVLARAAYGQGFISSFSTGGDDTGVQGAPYSADTINEITRTLTDGSHIQQETHGKVCRDSLGRTRTEVELAPFPNSEHLRHIVIVDPVQRTIAILDPRARTARVHRDSQISTSDSQRVMKMQPVQPQRHVTPPRSEQLGTKEIEGLTVTGTRHTRTIEAGEIGNDKPLVSISEAWYSPDLRTTVLSINDDPQWGRTTMRLTNIQREEPDPSLFQVPADYQIIDENKN